MLVTGGSEGVGFGVAKAFAEAHAAKIILASRSQEKLDTAADAIRNEHTHTEISTRIFDASDAGQIHSLWAQLAQDGTFIDVLVLNAAATETPKTVEDVIKVFNFNIHSTLHMLEKFKDQPNPEKKPKCLLSVASAGLHCYPYPKAAYAGSKAGVADYLCHIADLISESEMRIINFHPGAVYTPAAGRSGEVPKDMPIWDDPSLSAHMAVWLASEDAAFLHGRFIWANWNTEELVDMKDRILADPTVLKIGITGVDGFTVKKLIDKCNEVPVQEG